MRTMKTTSSIFIVQKRCVELHLDREKYYIWFITKGAIQDKKKKKWNFQTWGGMGGEVGHMSILKCVKWSNLSRNAKKSVLIFRGGPPSSQLKLWNDENFLSILSFSRWKMIFSKVAQYDARSLKKIGYKFPNLRGGGEGVRPRFGNFQTIFFFLILYASLNTFYCR